MRGSGPATTRRDEAAQADKGQASRRGDRREVDGEVNAGDRREGLTGGRRHAEDDAIARNDRQHAAAAEREGIGTVGRVGKRAAGKDAVIEAQREILRAVDDRVGVPRRTADGEIAGLGRGPSDQDRRTAGIRAVHEDVAKKEVVVGVPAGVNAIAGGLEDRALVVRRSADAPEAMAATELIALGLLEVNLLSRSAPRENDQTPLGLATSLKSSPRS